MNQKKDFYKILGVSKNSTKEEIKKAFRAKAIELHPDKNPGDKEAEAKFKEVSEAYEILSDTEKRKAYDAPSFSFLNSDRVYDFDSYASHFGNFYNINDLFGSYRTRSRQPQKIKGSNLKITLQVSLNDVLTGVEKTIKIQRDTLCNSCNGSCTEKNSKLISCATCGGLGYIEEHESIDGSIYNVRIVTRECQVCKGTGKIPEKICKTCSGNGTVKDTFQFTINLIKGIQDDTLLYRGYGNISKDNIPGDLYIQLNYEKNPLFRREGADITYSLKIGLLDVVFGTKMVVPTLHGDVTVKLSKGIKHGKLLKLSGKGLPYPNSNNYGNQYVTVFVDLPEEFTEEDEKILTSLSGDKWKKGIIE